MIWSSVPRRCLWSLVVVAVTSVAFAQGSYFPPKAFDDDTRSDQFAADWYSHVLECLREPSIWELSKNPSNETYRFLWLRTFDHPISVRLEVKPDGSGVLSTRIGSGSAGFLSSMKDVIESNSRTLKSEEVQSLLREVTEVDFWSIPSHIQHDQTGTDGSEWIIEAANGGHYHIVTRWSPYDNPVAAKRAIRKLGLALAFDLAKLDIPKEKIY